MIDVAVDDFAVRLPRELDDSELSRAAVLLADAAAEVEDAIRDHGIDPDSWLVGSNLRRAKRVVRGMTAFAILIGENLGLQSWSTGTGPYSESATYSGAVAPLKLWGEVELTDQMLSYLRLSTPPVLFESPPHDQWPEERRPWNR
ncbi:Gp19/Gp15/Gp42 family protein [Ancrocorticia populi]|uniref:Gp19/Gp15/Gp42 family protein n=1 Tax=Ancrocorticia populi TaxID=2175228 RepID=UPI003F9D2F8F